MSTPPIALQSTTFYNEQLARAQEFLSTGLGMHSAPEFPVKVNERLMIASDVAGVQAKKVKKAEMALVNNLLAQAFTSGKSKVNRIVWLQRAADQFAKAVGPHSACKMGCSHCCHIPVRVTHLEALQIGKAIGVEPTSNPKSLDVAADYSAPCVFLVDSACGIYQNRPVTCRTHLNMDADALLCELHHGSGIPVPLMDSRPFAMASISISGEHGRISDIRHWFPNGLADNTDKSQA
jgi:hypothetical protein